MAGKFMLTFDMNMMTMTSTLMSLKDKRSQRVTKQNKNVQCMSKKYTSLQEIIVWSGDTLSWA